MNKFVIVLVALYRYLNFPIRIMHPLLEKIEGVEPYTIFFKNYQTNVFNNPTTQEEKLFIEVINSLNPILVGFSVLSPYVHIARRLTKLIKNKSSSLVIWGGVHPTICPESCIDEVDMLCIGEGEGAITDLVEHLRDNKSYQGIKNLWLKNGNRVIKNVMRPLMQDLDSLPFPSYGNNSYYFIDSNSVTKNDPLFLDNYLCVQTSRGCPYVCSYCINSVLRPLYKDLGNYIRRKSVCSVTKEIKERLNFQKNKIDYVFFFDEGFGIEGPWLDEFEQQYKKEINLPFYVEYNPKNITSIVLSKLSNAGLHTINFGIQAGSDYIRNHIFNRPGENSEIINLSKKIVDYGIKIKYDLILNNPYDTGQSLKDTIELLLHLPKPLFLNIFSLQYFPNYPLTKAAIENRYINPRLTDIDSISLQTTKNWSFVPRPFPYTKKQIFQNIIWLIANSHINDNMVKKSVFGTSLTSSLCLAYLNIKSVVLGKIFGVGGFLWSHPKIFYFINGIKYIIKGDFKSLRSKIIKYVRIKKNPMLI